MKGALSRKKKDVSNHVELIDKFIRDKKATALIKDQAKHIENWGEDTWRTLIVALIRNRKNPFVPLNVEEARKRALAAIEEIEIVSKVLYDGKELKKFETQTKSLGELELSFED